MIPNIREKSSGAYCEDRLNRENKLAIFGFDMAVECIENFYGNLDVYDYPDKGTVGYEVVTKAVLESKDKLLEWMEMQRNELGVSLADGQCEEEK